MKIENKKINQLKQTYIGLPVSAKATFWFMICNVLQKGISVITTPIFTRMMTTEQYGQYTLFQSWLNIFTLVCTFRLNYSVFTKGMSKFPEEKDQFTASIQTTMTVITTIAFAIYFVLRNPINSLTDMDIYITLAMFVEIYFASSIQIWSLRHRFDFHYKEIIFPTLALSLLNPIVGVIAVHFSNEKGYARILSSVLIQVLFGIIFYYINIKKAHCLIRLKHAKFALIFNLPLIPHYLSTYVLDQADRVMIQKMCGYGDAAIYSVAYNAGTLMKIITDAINNSIIPWLYHKLEKKEYQNIEKYVFSVLLIIVLTCAAFISFAPEFVLVLGGKQYVNAVYVIPPVAASMFFTFFFSIISNIEFFYDANKFTMYISMVGAILNIVLNYIFIKKFGFVAAGYTTLFCYAFFSISHYIFMVHLVKKKVGIVLFKTKKIVLLALVLIFITIAMSLLYSHTLIRYIILIIILLLIYKKREFIIDVVKNKRKI